MKSIYSILIAILYCLICSCYTKQQAIDKFCSKDTAQVILTIHDTIITETIRTDTIFNDTVDSVFFTKNKIEIKYIKIGGKIEIAGKYLGDTIYYEKKVLIEVPIDCPKQSWFDQMILEAKWWILIIIAILILVIFKRNG
jgi:hypothetical protein